MGWIGFILMAIVDNPLVYGNNFMHPLFFLVGAANGISMNILSQDSTNLPSDENGTRSVMNARSREILKPILLR